MRRKQGYDGQQKPKGRKKKDIPEADEQNIPCQLNSAWVDRWEYRVIHKSLRNFRTRLRNNQERQGRKEHINRYRISQSFFLY